ncbi:hypothetical protein M3P05_20340 [Sansalvadorimonas sp. 2012CJ34-2]|uniref:Uncharacterized protein n=1 Tax=Parendozoicomonas callyspongiae TaxID=2942213 RepID=A0ABT0PLY6_9GAMM|nr:hypothetical protein [Sansalvadorimonas sp. 2012CJ34-2]MCL6272271.1 hypothetical protein [Sansalvadorimonas sp. 2012CJ34-2]
MSIYKILVNHEEFGYFELDLDRVLSFLGDELFMSFTENSSSLKKAWKPVSWEFIESVSSTLPDISCWGNGCLIFSKKAKDILYEHIDKDGEFLELTNKKYWVFNCLSRAKADINKSEEILDRGVHSGLKALNFNPKKVVEKNIFKTDFDYYAGFYCSEKIKNLIKDHRLSGIKATNDLAASPV